MLVLTRKVQESVIVGEVGGPHNRLKVTVLAVHGKRVKLGFELNSAITIQRWELWKGNGQVRVPDPPRPEDPSC